jgi:hypothetical protein
VCVCMSQGCSTCGVAASTWLLLYMLITVNTVMNGLHGASCEHGQRLHSIHNLIHVCDEFVVVLLCVFVW